MNCRHRKYIEIASRELLRPSLASTKQYLEVFEVEMMDGMPKVARVDTRLYKNIVAVWFHVKGERFYLVVNVTKKPAMEADFIWTESGNRAYLIATSDCLSHRELFELITLRPLSGWSINDLKKNRVAREKNSAIIFEPNKSEAYSLEDQLARLLIKIEKDKQGIKALSNKATVWIAIWRNQYVDGNFGLQIDVPTINKLHDLGLALDIGTHVSGKPLRVDTVLADFTAG